MKYNLAKYSQVTSSGSAALSWNELVRIINSAYAEVTVSSGSLFIDCDLGSRVHIDQIQYYTTGSGVTFYYKNELFESFTQLITYDSGTYFYTNIAGSSAPRYIKIEQTLTASGIVNGLVIQNNEDYVDFGENGNVTDHNINATIDNNLIQIDELAVYNSASKIAEAKVFIEPQESSIDNLISISDSEDGPWFGVYQDDDKVAGLDMWDTGIYSNTTINSDALVLSPGYTEGTFTTRIVDLEETQELTFVIADKVYTTKYKTIEFQDTFSTTTNDDWALYASAALYFNGSTMRMGASDGLDVRTTNQSLDFSSDWYFKTKLFHSNSAANWSLYLAGNKVRLNFDIKYNFTQRFNVYLQINGITKWSTSNIPDIKDWFEEVWFWVILQREGNTFRFKHWHVSESEPASWTFEGSINSNDINTSGYIRFYYHDFSYTRYIYADDLSLTKYYTSSGTEGWGLLSVDESDTYETLEVRGSNTRPLDRETYIESYNPGSTTTSIRHRYVWDSSLTGEFNVVDTTWGSSNQYWEVFYDNIREDTYLVAKNTYTPGNNNFYFYIYRKNGTKYELSIYSRDYDHTASFSVYGLSFDTTGGFWIYYFLGDNQNVPKYYYLEYYNSSLVLGYRLNAQGTFLYDLSTVYESDGDLWYTDSEQSVVFKTDKAGAVLASKAETVAIRGIVALNDGGCWYIAADTLKRLDSSGLVVDSFALPTAAVSYVYLEEGGDGFWLHDGSDIRYLDSAGLEIFSINIPNLVWINIIYSGVITKEHDGSTSIKPQASYISKYYKKVMRTWNYPQNEGGYKGSWDYSRYGFRHHPFDYFDNGNAAYFPIVPDTDWQNFEWKKVSLRDYNFSNYRYKQIRLTLRANIDTNSPEVYGIWNQRAIELPNILPYSTGTFYLKSDATDLTNDDTGTYNSNIRAWWYVVED